MAAATSHEVESSVIAVQLTRQYVIDVNDVGDLLLLGVEAQFEAAGRGVESCRAH
jgi:hypothetical protein